MERTSRYALPISAAGALAWLFLLILAVQGANPQRPPAGKTAPAALTVVLSGELNGHLTPCGCAKPMLGGLPRRARYLRALAPKTALVRVENGDLTNALQRQDEMKAETLVEMLNDLQYDAINLGEKDFRLGLPYLLALQDRFKGAFLCANARRMDDSRPFKEIAVVRRTVAGRPVRVVLAGLLSEQYAPQVAAVNPDVKIESALETLAALAPRLTAQGEARVLLYHGPRGEAEEIARRFPLFHLLVYAHEGDHPVEAARVGRTLLAYSGQDGKHIGQATLAPGATWRAAGAQHVALGPDFADDPRLLRTKQAYLERVAAEDLLGKVVKFPTPNGDTYAGSAACAPCHAGAHRIWTNSAHAKAMQTLVKEKHDRDPECVPCHVVGLEREGGFISLARTPHFKDVGCESCHGAAAKHASDPRTPMPKAGEASCQPCHVPEHSPRFDFAAYWAKIRH